MDPKPRTTLRVGRLFGIDIALDPGWFVLFTIIVWSTTSAVQAWHPLWTGGTALSVALVIGLAFSASLLLHELAHALVARAFGLPVRDITLHMFGGIAAIEKEPRTPGAETLIAAAGPVASVVLGAGMLALASAVTGSPFAPGGGAAVMSQLGPTATLLAWLGPVNVVIGLFNLIPGFPMDGGRILRAALWKLTGDLRVATRWSTTIGQGVGLAFIVAGALMTFGLRIPFLGSGLGSGLWIAFIGMFLRGAAKQQQVGAEVTHALEGVSVEDLMRTNVAGAPANSSLRALVEEWLLRREEGVVPVFFGERFLGLVGVPDVARVPREHWEAHTAREVLRPTASLPAVTPSDAALDALRKLGAARVKALPVFSEGELVGLLYESDCARWIAMHMPQKKHAAPGARPRFV